MEFLYGAGYYPKLHSKEEWKKDLDTMQKCNINIIRTAELFNTWDQIEPVRGEFDFEFLDEFFDECQRRGLKILLGTGTASPPYWLHEMDEDVNILSSSGKRYPNGVSYSWACFHNPTYLSESERYIRVLIDRYKNHKALYAYQIHNEIGLPFMPVSGHEIEMYCYCEHSKAEFRKWLQKKYKSLDELNLAWTWSATNIRRTEWSQVMPPMAKPSSWSSVTQYLDFRLFMMDTITSFVKWQNDLIKTMDTDHLTSTNIFYMKGEDKMSVMTAIDQFSIAKCVDVIGYDLYPGSGNKLESRPEFSSMFLDHARSISKPLGKEHWILEIESGPINGWALGPHRNTSGNDIRRYILESVAHDAKFTLYQGFRQWDFQPLNWGGLVDLDGEETERTKEASLAGKFLKDNSEFLNSAKTKKGDIAILTSKENAIIVNGMGQEDFLIGAISSCYKIFWQMGYNIDFIEPEHLKNGYANDYKAIIAPFMLCLSEVQTEDIKGYVKNGGIFIGQPRLSYVNEKGWFNHKWPAFALKEVFGVHASSIDSNIKSKITYKKKNYDGYWHKETLQLTNDNVAVLADFFDDTPAVTANNFGNGLGIYFATHVDQSFSLNQSYILWDIIKDIFSERGIEPEIDISYSNRLDREVDCHLLYGDSKDMVIITSFKKNNRDDFFIDRKKKITVKIKADKNVQSVVDAITGNNIEFKKENGYIIIKYVLNKYECPIWYIQR